MWRFHREMFCRIGRDWCGGNHDVFFAAHSLDAAQPIARIDATAMSQKDSGSEGGAIVATRPSPLQRTIRCLLRSSNSLRVGGQ
jgi:hypothetical protein